MPTQLVTGNNAAGHTLALAGEANRDARGCCCGAYPITPQTEIIEYLLAQRFTKGRIVPVESEHSAMGVCMGGALGGMRTFTASSANGLAYMNENIFATGYYRLPTVMIAVNRTMGPPWNIWVDQGDSLSLRDAPWIQLYAESHQELVDTILVAFRVAEDPRVMLPVMVCMDGFVVSHTQMLADLPDQEQVDRYLPPCKIPHQIDHAHPMPIGSLTWPRETEKHRHDIHLSMERVPEIYAEAVDEFEKVFGRRPHPVLKADQTDDAEIVLIACNTMARTARNVVNERRARGEKIGLVSNKLFRPYPRDELRKAIGSATKIAVLDRNHSPGSGGIFWSEVMTTLQGRSDLLIQNYIIGLGGGDVKPQDIDNIIDDLTQRPSPAEPIWQEVTA